MLRSYGACHDCQPRTRPGWPLILNQEERHRIYWTRPRAVSDVAQTSQSAVSPISPSAGCTNARRAASSRRLRVCPARPTRYSRLGSLCYRGQYLSLIPVNPETCLRDRSPWVTWPGYDLIAQDLAGNNHWFCPAGAMKRFGYLHDRLFGLCLAAYAVNRLMVLPHLAGFIHSRLPWAWPFLHSHLDDCLLIPAALPVVLWVQRHIGLRQNDGPPSWPEMFFHLTVWSVMCKLVGPFYCHIGVADPWDVLCFAAGGVAACLWWHRPAAQSHSVPA